MNSGYDIAYKIRKVCFCMAAVSAVIMQEQVSNMFQLKDTIRAKQEDSNPFLKIAGMFCRALLRADH
ncbi:MAG TPA: hypothetical protein PKB13_09005 [Clostridia bacterium]|nr:hypothetical protein [Clostridia bacterium]